MAIIRLTWNSLLRLSELEFKPAALPDVRISDELVLALSWLTGATGSDRRLIRCDSNGAMLINNAWSLLVSVQTDELYPQSGTPDSYVATVDNKGVLVSTSTQLVKISFVRKAGGASEVVYVPADTMYFFPNTVYSVTATTVPATGGTASYVGITAYN